jgi:hypothetical protein
MTTISDFTSIFSPANWNNIFGSGTISFNSPINNQLTINANAGLYQCGLSTSPPTLTTLPKGKISFSYDATGISSGSFWYYGANGNFVYPGPGIGSISNIQIDSGGTFVFQIGGDSPSTLIITNWQFQYDQENIPCFNEGSKILCLKNNEEVYVPIEKLKKGDLVKTYKHGYKKIEIIGNKKIYNMQSSKKENRIYRLSKDNYNDLFQDLYLTGFHSILVDKLNMEQRNKTLEIMNNIYITDDKYRLITCLDSRAELVDDEKEYTIYHFALENDDYYMNYGVYANGLLVESTSLRYMTELSGMKIN